MFKMMCMGYMHALCLMVLESASILKPIPCGYHAIAITLKDQNKQKSGQLLSTFWKMFYECTHLKYVFCLIGSIETALVTDHVT